MRKILLVVPIFLLLLSSVFGVAHANAPYFVTVPDVIRPGKYYDIVAQAPYSGNASLTLLDANGGLSHTIMTGYPLTEGENSLVWDGMQPDGAIIGKGEYTLCIQMDDGTKAEWPVRIGDPYPLLTVLFQSGDTLVDTPLTITYNASEDGTLAVSLHNPMDGTTTPLTESAVRMGANTYIWDGTIEGARVPNGTYALIMLLRATGGSESIAHYVSVDVGGALAQPYNATTETVIVDATPSPAPDPGSTIPEDAPMETEPDPAPLISSPPYSTVEDGTFWSMTPGETDDAVIWDILMQPITVYDGGIKAGVKGHAYLMENPDGSGKQVAQLHTQSQGVHVIGEVNEHGYVLVEAFSNYDREYYPATAEEQASAFELKQGYVLAEHLKTVEVMTDMALLVDKLTQRMYLFVDGVRVTELVISTGVWSDPKDMLFETVPGEFITVSHTGSLVDGNMTSEMAIRINGGILFHEVPHKTNADGTFNYSSFEAYLGTKQSHGCIRVQRLKNPDGYNQRWLWDNLQRGKPYKVIIWDDANRADTPETWYENPSK